MERRALPRVYAILDGGVLRGAGLELLEAARALRAGGVRLLQYRDKGQPAEVVLKRARAIGIVFAGSGAVLLLNDWPELVVPAGWDGVHVGQGDAPVAEARVAVGTGRVVGVSTHTADEVRAAERSAADYVAIGPVFQTTSKEAAEPAVGMEGVRVARCLTTKPLVAIGGIALATAGEVLAAGADSVAVIGALLLGAGTMEERTRALLAEAARERG